MRTCGYDMIETPEHITDTDRSPKLSGQMLKIEFMVKSINA